MASRDRDAPTRSSETRDRERARAGWGGRRGGARRSSPGSPRGGTNALSPCRPPGLPGLLCAAAAAAAADMRLDHACACALTHDTTHKRSPPLPSTLNHARTLVGTRSRSEPRVATATSPLLPPPSLSHTPAATMDGQDWETRVLRKKPASSAPAKDEASINAVRFFLLLLLLCLPLSSSSKDRLSRSPSRMACPAGDRAARARASAGRSRRRRKDTQCRLRRPPPSAVLARAPACARSLTSPARPPCPAAFFSRRRPKTLTFCILRLERAHKPHEITGAANRRGRGHHEKV